MTKDMDIDLEIEADEVAYIYLGTDKHNNLKNLDLPDSHPIRAITGLQEVVDKVGRTEDGAEVNEIVGVRVNGTPLDIAADRTVDVEVPTSYGYYLDLNGNNGIVSLKDRNGVVLSTIDTNLERIVESGRYDASTNELVLVLDDNSEIRIDASKLVDVYTADGETIVENGHVFALSEGSKNALNDSKDHIADRSNPHNVTKDQVGLSNVDNTSDMSKPVSTLMQQALDGKADDSAVVHKSGDTMTGELIAKGGVRADFVRKFDNNNANVGYLIFEETESSNIASLNARKSTGADTAVYPALKLFANDDGTYYAVASSSFIGQNDNSDKILTIKMANSLPSLVHTTGNEEISGNKTFTNLVHIKSSNPYYVTDSTVMDFTSTTAPQAIQRQGIYHRDLNGLNLCALEYTINTNGNRSYALAYRKGHDSSASNWAYLGINETASGTIYGSAPATNDAQPDNAIVTKKYLLDKIAALEARISALEGTQ